MYNSISLSASLPILLISPIKGINIEEKIKGQRENCYGRPAKKSQTRKLSMNCLP